MIRRAGPVPVIRVLIVLYDPVGERQAQREGHHGAGGDGSQGDTVLIGGIAEDAPLQFCVERRHFPPVRQTVEAHRRPEGFVQVQGGKVDGDRVFAGQMLVLLQAGVDLPGADQRLAVVFEALRDLQHALLAVPRDRRQGDLRVVVQGAGLRGDADTLGRREIQGRTVIRPRRQFDRLVRQPPCLSPPVGARGVGWRSGSASPGSGGGFSGPLPRGGGRRGIGPRRSRLK